MKPSAAFSIGPVSPGISEKFSNLGCRRRCPINNMSQWKDSVPGNRLCSRLSDPIQISRVVTDNGWNCPVNRCQNDMYLTTKFSVLSREDQRTVPHDLRVISSHASYGSLSSHDMMPFSIRTKLTASILYLAYCSLSSARSRCYERRQNMNRDKSSSKSVSLNRQ